MAAPLSSNASLEPPTLFLFFAVLLHSTHATFHSQKHVSYDRTRTNR